MKILAVAHEESKYLWDFYEPEKLRGYDLIIGCGDLNIHYLTFLASVAPIPVIYVHGNHDEVYDQCPPSGALCIDDDVFCYKGYRFLGLGGSCRYRTGAWQFTEAEMRRRIRRVRGKVTHAGGVDVLVTHAPLHGYGDLNDLPHRGFTVFQEVLNAYKPAVMLHGHVHLNYNPSLPREQQYGQTRIINAFERYTIELPERPELPVRQSLLARWRAGR